MPSFDRAKLRRDLAIRGLSYTEVAEKAELNVATIYNAAKGKNLHPRNFRKIALVIAAEPVIPGLAEMLNQAALANDDPRVAVVYVVDRGLVLLCRRRYREGSLEWAAIDTEIEGDEDPAAAAVRAARERVGLDIEVIEELGERDHPATGRQLVYFGARLVGGEAAVLAPDSISAVEWCDFASVLMRLGVTEGGIFPPAMAFLEKEMAR